MSAISATIDKFLRAFSTSAFIEDFDFDENFNFTIILTSVTLPDMSLTIAYCPP